MRVWVDGQLAAGKRLDPGGERLVRGYSSKPGSANTEEREFCFSRPRLVRPGESLAASLSEAERCDLASIRVEIYPATRGATRACEAKLHQGRVVSGVNKAAAKQGKVGSVARSGNVVSRAAHGRSTSYHVEYETVLCRMRVRYASRTDLQRMTDSEPAATAAAAGAPSSAAAAMPAAAAAAAASPKRGAECPAAVAVKREKRPRVPRLKPAAPEMIDLS